MVRKIGFRNEEIKEDPAEKLEQQTQELVRKLINSIYAFNGETEKKVFKTTSELAFEFVDMIKVPSETIALVLHKYECEIINMDGKACWVLYEKE